LGPLGGDVIRYHASEGAINQIVGGDVAGLALVAPLGIISGVLVWRSHPAGPVLGIGPAFYVLYMYSQLALGGDVSRYEGNSERFFLLFVVLFAVAGAVAFRCWSVVDEGGLTELQPPVRRVAAGFLIIVALFLLVGLHLPGLVDAWSIEPTGAEYLADPVVFWLVKFMDLAIVVAVMAVVAVGSLRQESWAAKALLVVVGWSALLGASVAGMAVAMLVKNDPGASVTNVTAFATFALVALVLAGLVQSPMIRTKRRHEALNGPR
jgi:hypothetical protein